MSGTITFRQYPISNRVPGVWAEVDGSLANNGTINQRTLLVGQMISGSPGLPGVAVLSAGQEAVEALAGVGSPLALTHAAYRTLDVLGEVWVLLLADDPAATKTQVTITPIGVPTGAGTVSCYVAGQLVRAGVSAGESATSIQAALTAAANATAGLPATAAANGAGTATVLTALCAGADAGDLDVRFNFQGAAGGEAFPPGLSFAVQTTSGVTNPLVGAALANLSDQSFDFIAMPSADPTTAAAFDLFLSDEGGRWDPLNELFGEAFGVVRGTLGALAAYGSTRNGKHVTTWGFNDCPEPVYVQLGYALAAVAVRSRANPALPLQDMALPLLAPSLPNRFDISERNTLLYDGISTLKVNDFGTVLIERCINNYQVNAAGSPDDSFLDTEINFQLMFGIRDMRAYFTSLGPLILVADGTPCPAGSSMTTSQILLALAVARYKSYCAVGLMQDYAGFAKAARAQNKGNGVCAFYLPWRLSNQLRDLPMLVQFTKP